MKKRPVARVGYTDGLVHVLLVLGVCISRISNQAAKSTGIPNDEPPEAVDSSQHWPPKMAITPTQFAQKTRQSANWPEAKRRVLHSYRQWIRAAPEVQTMYNLPMPVSVIRTRMREEFERHRFANKLSVVDVLLFKSHADYQETMNFWRQTNHIMSYFKNENFRGDDRLPKSFMSGFLEGRN
ncbi:NADH-ubiquinone oxidoreductase 14.8 kDa subunit like protein [Verticillium longisporum]|nr:NADH-ubiquinone oxidoreductase 14.8 kDa subunit like protein [Verticillium longisporum]